jgi:hypothetical protein
MYLKKVSVRPAITTMFPRGSRSWKVVLLAQDDKIKNPTILEQLRSRQIARAAPARLPREVQASPHAARERSGLRRFMLRQPFRMGVHVSDPTRNGVIRMNSSICKLTRRRSNSRLR